MQKPSKTHKLEYYDGNWWYKDTSFATQKQAKEYLFKEMYRLSFGLTADEKYKEGYEDGKAGKAMNANLMTDSDYTMGYEDGKGDHHIEAAVDPQYVNFNEAPDGFLWAGRKAVPAPYQFYLSKNGSPTYLTRERKNSQTRHILVCETCGQSDARYCPDHDEVTGRG